MSARVLVIDDEIGVRKTLSLILAAEGYEVECVESGYSGLRLIDNGKNYDFIICDIRMPGMDGIEFLKEIKNRDLDSILIMISAYGTVETSIEAIKCGAADYVSKPINTEELILRMRMAEERERLRRENTILRKELGKDDGFEEIVFVSEKMRRVVDFAKRVSEYEATVLITGETGTGKDLIAKAIHQNSKRGGMPFIEVNCAAIPDNLLESELFGVIANYPGFHNKKPLKGKFELSNGGTIFLNEIGELPQRLQAKLLEVLEKKRIWPLGANQPISVDTRIIAATNRDLKHEVREGHFREDLYERLNILPLHLPPLRERKEDIPRLVDFFLRKHNEKLNRYIKEVSQQVMTELIQHPWYGNVRELENVLERAMILTDSDLIDRVDLVLKENNLRENSWLDSLSLDKAWQKLEKAFIEKALSESSGNRTQAAKLLGLSRRALLYKLKQYGYSEEEE